MAHTQNYVPYDFVDEKGESDGYEVAVLKAIDENWVEQVDYLQQLKTALSGQHFSMKNPLVEYYQEAYDGFEYMKERMKQQIVKNLLMSELALNPKGEVIMYFP